MKKLTLILITLAALTACKKEPEEVEENDVITTIKLSVRDTATNDSRIYYFRDLDGEGGNAPVSDTMLLSVNSYYEAEVDLSNERQTPAQSVTAEINANKEEHQLFFKSIPAGFLNELSYKDLDANSKPLGLKIGFRAKSSPGSGSLEIILRHNLNKSGVNVSNGDITNAGGESEIEVDFPFVIQ